MMLLAAKWREFQASEAEEEASEEAPPEEEAEEEPEEPEEEEEEEKPRGTFLNYQTGFLGVFYPWFRRRICKLSCKDCP